VRSGPQPYAASLPVAARHCAVPGESDRNTAKRRIRGLVGPGDPIGTRTWAVRLAGDDAGVDASVIEREEWRPIDEAPGYAVSSWGRVRRGAEIVEPWENAKGYHCVNLELAPLLGAERPRVLVRYVHRLVLLAFDPPRRKLQVNHENGRKAENVRRNLSWTTPAGNLTHAWATGLISRIRRRRDVCRHGHPLDQVYRQRDRHGVLHTWRRCSRCRRARDDERRHGVRSLLDLIA